MFLFIETVTLYSLVTKWHSFPTATLSVDKGNLNKNPANVAVTREAGPGGLRRGGRLWGSVLENVHTLLSKLQEIMCGLQAGG